MIVYLCLVIQQLIASTTHLVAQDVTQVLPAPAVLLFRCTGASLIFLPLMFYSTKEINIFRRVERKDYGNMLVLGLLNVPINQLLYLHGVKLTTPANSALLYALTPAMVFLLTAFRGDRRQPMLKMAGIVIAFLGVAILMFEHGATMHSDHTVGDIFIFIAVVAWSLYTMLGRPMVQKYGAVYTTGLNMIIGTLLYLPFGLLSTSVAEISHLGNVTWIEVAYLAAFSSVANYIMWYWALGKLETTKVAIFQNLQPVLTTVMALILGKAILTLQLFGGGLLTLLGVLVVQFA